jgi:hypothetical protein
MGPSEPAVLCMVWKYCWKLWADDTILEYPGVPKEPASASPTARIPMM